MDVPSNLSITTYCMITSYGDNDESVCLDVKVYLHDVYGNRDILVTEADIGVEGSISTNYVKDKDMYCVAWNGGHLYTDVVGYKKYRNDETEEEKE